MPALAARALMAAGDTRRASTICERCVPGVSQVSGRRRDSNPRMTCTIRPFSGAHIRPLCHASVPGPAPQVQSEIGAPEHRLAAVERQVLSSGAPRQRADPATRERKRLRPPSRAAYRLPIPGRGVPVGMPRPCDRRPYTQGRPSARGPEQGGRRTPGIAEPAVPEHAHMRVPAPVRPPRGRLHSVQSSGARFGV